MKTKLPLLLRSVFSFLMLTLLFFVSENANAQYCTSGGPSSTYDSNVDSVYLAGDASSAISFKGCPGVAGVQDLTTSTNVNLTVGSTYTLKVQFGTCGGNYSGQGRAWIDWNKNGVFESGETIGYSGGTPGSWAMSTWNFTVPMAGMTNGPTRMRVMQWEGGSQPLNPCGSYSWGSVTDFTVTIGGVYIPQTDLAVTSWDYPYSGCGMSTTEPISISVKNSGTVTQSSYTLKYSLNNGTTWVSQAVTTPIMPDSTLSFTFNTTGNFATTGTYNCLAAVILPNDSATYNDTISSQIIATAGMIIPYFDNLETWTVGQYGANMGGAWTGSTTSNPRWEVENSSGSNENSYNTGPFYDHTNFGTAGGKYVYMETSGGSLGSTSYLTSPCVNFGGQPAVLNFWYHMYGAAMGTLEVQQKVGGVWVSTGWSKTGQQQTSGGAAWLEATITLNGAANGIRFKGIRGSSYTSDMCLDDIKIYIPMPNNLALLDWVAPLSGTAPSATMPISIDVFNAGLATQDSFPLKYSIDGGTTWVSEVYNDTLAPADTLHYTFTTTANMTTPGYYNCIGVVSNSGDGDASNDTVSYSPYLCSSLSGTYTIGPDSTDNFATFSDAVFALNNCGVSGLTIFNVDSGTYTEQLTLGTIPGASATNRVIFTAANHDSTSVTLQYAPTSSSNNWTLKFDGCEYITFKHMTIKTTGSSYGRVVQFSGANHNRLENNIIMSQSGATSGNFACIYNYNSLDEYNYIGHNRIVGGYYSLYMYGTSSSNLEKGNVVEYNEITDYYYYGAYNYYQDSITYKGNIVTNASNSGSVYGFRFYYCDASQIIGNQIYLDANYTHYGMYMYYCDSTATSRSLVANNMISTVGTGTSSHYGIYYNYGKGCDFVYNSLYNEYGSSSAYNFRLYNVSSSYSGHRIYNNNFVNMGPGYAAYVYNNNYITGADNNNFYAPNNSSHLCYWGGYRTDLTALKAAYSGTNQNSVSTNANYFAWNDLHVNTPAINGMATPLSYITDDIDGDARTSTPDIGADEFVIINNDAGVTSLDAPIAPCPGTPANVMVTIKDFGLLSLVSATVNWEVNGVLQTPASFGGTIGNLADTMLSLGNYTFLANTPYNIKVWTSSPNAVADQKTSNDTLFINGMQTALSGGTYTIGSDTTDTWPSFTAAINTMTANGVCGAIVVNVDTGTYVEQLTIPEILGTSATNTITFKSATGTNTDVVLTDSSTNSSTSWTVGLNGADYITFKDMTIAATGNYGRTITLQGGANHNTFEGNIISTVVGTSSYFSGIYDASGIDEFNSYIDNVITGGYYGLYIFGSSNVSWEKGTLIDGNDISDYYYYGIQSYYQDSISIVNNYIHDPTYGYYGIYTYYNFNGCNYSNNKIVLNGTSYSKYALRIYYNNYHSYAGTSAPNLVSNNMIITDGGNGYGIYAYNSDKVNYYYNSVNIVNGTSGYGLYQHNTSSNSTGQTFKNNIFSNTSGGYAAYFGSSAYVAATDYNNFYATGSYLAYWSGAKANLTALQNASSKDMNSVSIDPEFFSNTDLHTYSIAMADKGTPVSVTTDYDGTTRSTTTPDVGADEYTTPANNLGVVNVLFDLDTYCGTNDSLYIVVKNFGTATQTNVPVSFVGTTPSGALSLSGVISSIASLQIDTVYMGMLNATVGGTYTANAYCTLSTDTSTYNDTMSVTGDVYIPEAIGYGDDFSTWPPMHWDVNGNGTFAWKHHSSGAAYADFWNVSTGACEMLSPTVVIPTTATSYLGFSYAYTGQYIASYADTLQVYAKACGDANWTLLWEKGGSDLVTPGGGATSPGTYLDANVVIPSSMQGSNVQIMFRGVTDYGPNLYLNDMSVFTAPAVALGADTAVCSGDTITLDAGTFIGAKYLWTRGLDTLGTTQTLDATSTGSYIAHVSQYGIAGTDAININVNPLPTLNVMGLATSYCENEAAATLSAIPAGGTFTGNGVIGNDFDPALAGLGNQDITYAYTDMNGCSNTAMVSTMVKAAPVITTSGNVTICEGTSTTLTASVPTVAADLFFSEYIEGSSNNKALEIYNGTGDTVYLANYQIAQAVNGNGWAYYHTFPAGAYILNGDVWVMVADQIFATLFDTTNADEVLSYPSVCHFTGDDARALIKVTATDTTFLDIIGDPNNDPGSGWNVAGVSHATKDHSMIRKSAVTMGDTSWTNVAGTDSMSSQYMVYPKNTFSFLGSHTMTGPANYMWSTMDNTPSTVVSPVSTTDYYVTVTGANACDNVDTLTVDVLAAPMVALGADQALCASETLSLDAGAGIDYTYMWNNGDTTQMITADSTGIGVATGNYSVVVTDSNTCMGYDTIALTFMAEPMVTIMGSDTVKMSWNASFDAGTGFSTYLWSNGWTNQTVLFGSNTLTPGDTTIDVQVTNANGCYGYDTITFYVLDDVGFGDNNSDMNLEVYPNPSNGQFTMAISGFTGELDMNIVDLSGKVITTKQLDVTSNFAEKFDVSDLAKGVYYIKLISKDGVKVEKLIIQ